MQQQLAEPFGDPGPALALEIYVAGVTGGRRLPGRRRRAAPHVGESTYRTEPITNSHHVQRCGHAMSAARTANPNAHQDAAHTGRHSTSDDFHNPRRLQVDVSGIDDPLPTRSEG